MGYLGSKAASGAYQAIISQMPPHDLYMETHLGGGAIMQRKPAALVSIGIDIDPITIDAAQHLLGETDINLVCNDAVQYLNTFDFSVFSSPLVYVDPPYLAETRTSNARYRHEYTRADHVRLIETLRLLPASVMISGYPSALYDELLADWRSIQFQVMTRGGVRTEQLWMNYAAGSAYCATFAGKDYIDRQRIKRKADRWEANYSTLDEAERLAILSRLIATHEISK